MYTNGKSKLSPAIAECIRNTVPLFHGSLEEIRLRCNRPVALTISGQNIPLEQCCTEEDMQKSLQMLCDHSLYSHAETLREGYICVAEGIRAGVCGRAVLENGRIALLRDIHSICIRLPSRIPTVGQAVYEALDKGGFRESVLVYAPPGLGKTTVLREVAARLANPPHPLRVAVVDTRYELCAGLEDVMMLDILYGYPRNQGMEIAMRTLSPEYSVCDEITSAEDRMALVNCAGSGIRLCASVHAGSLEELLDSPLLKTAPGIFQWYYGLGEGHVGTLTAAGKETQPVR